MKIPGILTLSIPLILLLFIGAKKESNKIVLSQYKATEYPVLIDEHWMGIYFEGKKLGFSYSAYYSGEKGYRVLSRAVVRLSEMDTPVETSFNQETFLSKNLELLEFNFLQSMGGHEQSITGVAENNYLEMVVISSGATSKKRIVLPAKAIPGSGIELLIKKRGFKRGDDYILDLFMEPLQSIIKLQIQVIGKEELAINGKKIRAYKVMQTYKTIKAYTWYSLDGRILKEVSLEGFESFNETESEALKFTDRPPSINTLITFSLIRTDKKILSPQKVKFLKINLNGLPAPDLVPEDGRQKIIKTDQTKNSGSGYGVLLEVKDRYDSSPTVMKSKDLYLAPTSEIQSDFHEIAAKSKEIVGTEKDLYKKAKKITDWVYNYLDKKMVDTFSAVDALHTKEGECQSHSNLFAALARAAGIPTRIASGLVYSNSHQGFLYHAWPEIFIDNWIAVDPTFGQHIADATHIKLAEGGAEEQLNLLNFIGKAGIEVIEIKY